MNLENTIFAEHAMLRGLLSALDDAGRRVLVGEPGAMTALRDAVRALDVTFRGHLAVEESLLVSVLSSEQLEFLRREHRQQRAMLEAIVGEIDHGAHDATRIADDALWLVRALERDMDAEDASLLRIASHVQQGAA
jgi:hemerythrin-like domain-containing protein